MATQVVTPPSGSGNKPGPAPEAISDAASGGGYAPAAVLPVPRLGLPDLPPGRSTPTTGAVAGVSVNSITGIRTPQQLAQAARDQVNAEISGQEAPLQGELGTLAGRETSATGALKSLYGSLMPYVSGEAGLVADTNEESQAQQQALFSTANAQMNQQLQSRAQQAQALAQEMGGPVAISDFNGNLGSYAETLASTGEADQLHAIGAGQAGVDEAAAFAGRVFPLSAAEHQTEITNYFEGEQKKIRDQITTLEGTKQGKINSALNDMLTKERDYALQKHQQTLDAKKQAQDTIVQQHTLANDDKRLKLAQDEFAQGKAVQDTTLKLRSQQISNQAIEAAAKLGLSKQQLQAKIAAQTTSSNIAEQRLKIQEQKNAISLTAAAGKPNKPVTLTRRFVLDPVAAQIAIAKGSTSIYRDPKTGKYFTTKQVTKTAAQWQSQNGVNVSGGDASSLSNLYKTMIGEGISKQVALSTIRKKFNKPSWTP